MNSFKSKKTKVFMSCLAVILIVSVLCVTLAACKNETVPPTPVDVFFLGDMQKSIDAEQLKKITADGKQIVSVQEMLDETKYELGRDTNKIAAAIYALAATNYNNVTQAVYYIMTDASVEARETNLGTAHVGVRSTYSSVTGKNGTFSQTVSGVTRLDGLGNMIGSFKGKFGYNIQSFSNDKFSVGRQGNNGGAQFATSKNLQENLKYIMGAYNTTLTNRNKGFKLTANDKISESDKEPELPEYVQTATTYPEGTTLAGKELPSFNKDRKAWEPLNRIPARYWERDEDGNLTGNIVENYTEDQKTRYSFGTYGAGWAVYDLSRVEYYDNGTTVNYNKDLDLWTIDVSIKNEFVPQACEFAAGDLIRDTKSYISLKNAQFTNLSCKIEVYGNGLIKSMQKFDGLETNDPSPVLGGSLGNCKKGGKTSNQATAAFSYTDADCDALKYAALYWAELGTEKFYTTIKDQDGKSRKDFKLDLSSYPTISTYQPTVNTDLFNIFTNIFADKK